MRVGLFPLFGRAFKETTYYEDATEFGVTWEQAHASFESNLGLINNGKLDFFIFPLHFIPMERSDEIKIWALTKRKLSGYMILSRIGKGDENMFGVPKGKEIYFPSYMIHEILSEALMGYQLIPQSEFQILSWLESETIDYAIIPKVYFYESLGQSFKIFNLNEREFLHAPGNGAWAIIGKKDHQEGKLLRSLHHQETGFLCNLERKAAILSDGSLNVYAEKNDNTYHMWGISKKNEIVKEAQISQSTRNELAERLVSKFDF